MTAKQQSIISELRSQAELLAHRIAAIEHTAKYDSDNLMNKIQGANQLVNTIKWKIDDLLKQVQQ